MEWKNHPEITNYEISSCGQVRHKVFQKIRKQRLDKDGYLRINILHNGKHCTYLVYRLVAKCFLGDSAGLTINHIDGDKINNKKENLEIISSSENTKHAFKKGLVKTSHKCVINGKEFYSKREASRITGIPRNKI